MPVLGYNIADILCEQFERTVGKDNCVQFNNIILQIPPNDQRMHYNKVRVKVHRYCDGTLALFHGPRCLAKYTDKGQVINQSKVVAA